MLDLGMFLMTHAFRSGIVKGYKTAEELHYNGPNEIQCTDEALDMPIFQEE